MKSEGKRKVVEDWEQLLKLLPTGWEEQASRLGALKFGRSFSGPESLLRTLLIYLSDDCSMRETTERARLGGVVKISDVGLLKRINKSGEWLRWISERLIQERPSTEMQCAALAGRRVLAIDGSVVSAPGAVTSTWRVHYAMDIGTLACCQAQVTAVKTGESLTRFALENGDIVLADRGFANRRGINHVLDAGGDVLLRMNLSSVPLTNPDGSPFEQLPCLRQLQKGQTGEWPATMQGTHGPVAVRVCAYRKTDEQRMESQRKQRQEAQKKQKQLKPETIEAAGYVVVVTTLTCLSATEILALYRHRWQVELAFKRMKSLLGLSCLRKKDPEGAKAWLQGKMLVACLIERFIALGEFFSPEEHSQQQGERRHRAAPMPLA